MAQLRHDRAEFEGRGAHVYTITTGTPADSAAFCREREVPFPCLVDEPGEPGYRAFGLAKVGLRRLFGPSLLEALVTLAKRFREVEIPKSGDVYQMSGTFVVDGGGIVRLAHPDEHPGDHIANEEVWHCLDAIGAAASA